MSKVVSEKQVNTEANISTGNLQVWHKRLGHFNVRKIRDIVSHGIVCGVKLGGKAEFFREWCQLGK